MPIEAEPETTAYAAEQLSFLIFLFSLSADAPALFFLSLVQTKQKEKYPLRLNMVWDCPTVCRKNEQQQLSR